MIITYYICKFFSVFYFEVFETHTKGEHTYNLHVDGAIADTIRMFQLSLLAGTPLPTNRVKKIYVKQSNSKTELTNVLTKIIKVQCSVDHLFLPPFS